MRDQSGKCILQHVSQSIGTPSVMHCVGTGVEGGGGGDYGGRQRRWRKRPGTRASVHARRAHAKTGRDGGL